MKPLLILTTLLIVFFAPAQNNDTVPKKRCGTVSPSVAWDNWFNLKVAEYKAEKADNKSRMVSMVIPVIVHVIHGGQSIGTFPNISQAQIVSQIKVFNDDFAGQGHNVNKLAATGFSAVGAANTNITFCLAQFDPNGAPLAEPGIERLDYNVEGWQNPAVPGSANNFSMLMDGTIKPASIWDPTRYCNIWVSDVNPTAYLLGYATFPGGSGLSDLSGGFGTATDDGLWIWAKVFGSEGILDPVYNKGRTAVHELGHWFGLRHIGGDATNPSGDCLATDYCADTPPQKGGFGGGTNGQNYGSPTYPIHVNVCGSAFGDMFMNFMDYTEDDALYMFTADQGDRMRTAMLNGWFRKDLSASSATQCVGLPAVIFDTDTQLACLNRPEILGFETVGQGAVNYSWTAEPSNGVVFSPSNTSAAPTINFASAANYTVRVKASNLIGSTLHEVIVNASQCSGISNVWSVNTTFRLFPNPTSDQVILHGEFPIKNEKFHLLIYNMLGEIVYDSVFSVQGKAPLILNTGMLQNGIYTVKLNCGGESASSKLVISR